VARNSATVHPDEAPVTRFLLSLILIAILMPAAGVARAAVPPTVVFQVETEAGREAAERCHAVWLAEGPEITRRVLGEGAAAVPDTVLCLILGTEAFHRHFGGTLPDWGVGAAAPGGRVIAIDPSRLPAVGRGLREVFLHEMVHALLFQGAGEAWLPAWFHEGTAMLVSGEWRFSDTVSLILDGQVPALDRLQGRFPVSHARADRAYRTSLLAVSRLEELYGRGIVPDLVAATKKNGNFFAAFHAVTGEELDIFQQEFARAMRLRFGWMLFLTRWPGLFVLLALVLAVGGARKIVLTRRRLAAMEDDDLPPPPVIPSSG
jgi:hypothetical protein